MRPYAHGGMEVRPGFEWRFLRMAIVLLTASTLLYVSVPDYPYDQPLFMALVLDSTGWLHECFYILVGGALLVEWTFRCEERQSRPVRRRTRIKRRVG